MLLDLELHMSPGLYSHLNSVRFLGTREILAFAKNCSKALKFRTGLAYSNHAAQWTSEGIPTAAEAESPFDPGFTWGTVTSYPNLTPRGGSGVCQTSQPLLRHLPLHLPRLLLVSTFPHQSLTFLITRGAGAGDE